MSLDIAHLSAQPRRIDIASVDDWRIFTALDNDGDGYTADSYDQQIDCPMESASHYILSKFEAGGIVHEVVFTGTLSDDYDVDGMTEHLKNICQAEIALFGDSPLDKYLFLNYIEAQQYGGLEHKNSVAQMAAPDMMMKKGAPLNKRMVDFLGLCSHEYFHLWNVKRLQPKDFQPYDLYREQNTEMLWFFEGMTSYYDELFLLRAGVVDAPTFLTRQAENLSRVLSVPGRKLQPLAASSFDAWTKLYQADANSPNNMVSYYSKGAVFALFLDLFIRKHSEGKSLDDVMRYLWKNYGEKGIGIDEDDVFAACCRHLPDDAHELLANVFVEGLHGTADMPFAELLPDFGVTANMGVQQHGKKPHVSASGLRLNITGDKAKIVFLDANSQAARIGVSVGDEVLAIDGQTATTVDFNQRLSFGNIGEQLVLTLSRRGRVFEKTLELEAPAKNTAILTLRAPSALGDDWLASWL